MRPIFFPSKRNKSGFVDLFHLGLSVSNLSFDTDRFLKIGVPRVAFLAHNLYSSTVVVHLSDQAVRGSIIGAFFRQAPNVSAI